MMNVPRMMRPGMANPNANAAMINPNNSLRHLLQPQGQVELNIFDFRTQFIIDYIERHFFFILTYIFLISIPATAAKSIPAYDGNARTKQHDESEYDSTKSTVQRSKFRIYAMKISLKFHFYNFFFYFRHTDTQN